MCAGNRIRGHLQFLTGEQRGEHELRHVFRQRRNRCEDQRRWTTQKHRHRQRLIQLLRLVIMKPAALLDLPMQSSRTRVVDLHTIDAEIVFSGERVLDRKSTRLNSSHSQISYAVFCLKKKKNKQKENKLIST